jgi:hypothetical protein
MLHILMALFGLAFLFDGAAGASGGDAGGSEGGGDGGDDAGDDGADDGADDGDEPLREPGKRALDDERVARKAADKRARKAERDLATALAATQTDAEKATATAVDEAKKEVATGYRTRILEAEVLAAAGGRLHNPADAIAFLDLTELDPDTDPTELRATITAAIDAMLKERPYLRSPKTSGDADGGAKPKPATDDKDLTPTQRMSRAYETSDT